MLFFKQENCLVVRTNTPKRRLPAFTPYLLLFHLLKAGLNRKQACDRQKNEYHRAKYMSKCP